MSSDLAKKTVEEGSYGEATTNLADFAVKNGFHLRFFTLPDRDSVPEIGGLDDMDWDLEYYVNFEETYVLWKEDGKIVTILGVGVSKEEAIENYKGKIAGRTIVRVGSKTVGPVCPLFWLPEPKGVT